MRFEHLPAVDAEAAVKIAEVLTEGAVLRERQKAITKIFVDGHPALQRLGPRADAAAEHHVADAQLDEAHRQRDHPAVVLVVGVDHHHHVGAAGQRLAVTGLLVAAVTAVLWMDNDRETHVARDLHRAVGAAVVHEDHFVDGAGGDVGQRRRQRPLGVVGRHHGHDAVLPLRRVALRLEDAIHVKELVARSQVRTIQEGHGAGYSGGVCSRLLYRIAGRAAGVSRLVRHNFRGAIL